MTSVLNWLRTNWWVFLSFSLRQIVLTTVLTVLVRTEIPLCFLADLLLWFNRRKVLILSLVVTLVSERVPITVECTPVSRFLGKLGKAVQRRLAMIRLSMELLRNLRCLPAGIWLPLQEHEWRITVSGRAVGTSVRLSCLISLVRLIRVLIGVVMGSDAEDVLSGAGVVDWVGDAWWSSGVVSSVGC